MMADPDPMRTGIFSFSGPSKCLIGKIFKISEKCENVYTNIFNHVIIYI